MSSFFQIFSKNRATLVFIQSLIQIWGFMANIARYRELKFFKKILVIFFRQTYEGCCNVNFIRKSKTGGNLLLEIKKSTSFANLLIPPCLFQLHRKHKKNSILIQNTYTFVGTYLKVIEIFTKYWTLVFDITQTFKEKNCFLIIRAQILLG